MKIKHLSLLMVIFVLAAPGPVYSQDEPQGAQGSETWLPALTTNTPQEGFELAVTLARKGVSTTQTDKAVLKSLREDYARDPDSLIAVSHVIAVHFQTIAAANDYWRAN
ncbi:MAG: hexameric tyrosine-coordinated heme protein [Porticoccaceae bacterium]